MVHLLQSQEARPLFWLPSYAGNSTSQDCGCMM